MVPRGRANLEEPPRYFLPRADFGEGPIPHRVEVDAERFLVRAQFRTLVVRDVVRIAGDGLMLSLSAD